MTNQWSYQDILVDEQSIENTNDFIEFITLSTFKFSLKPLIKLDIRLDTGSILVFKLNVLNKFPNFPVSWKKVNTFDSVFE